MLINKKEKEIIVLKSVTDLINSMVNNYNLTLLGPSEDTTVMFKDSSEQKLFYVLFVDLLSRPSEEFFGKSIANSLVLLESLVQNDSSFGNADSLLDALSALLEWLEVKYTFDNKWFPSINREIDITMSRKDMIKICGNISKHSLTRLTSGVSPLIKRNIPSLRPNEELVIVSEFYDHFHEDILNYHSTILVEFLNNLRWGIQDYLANEFLESRNLQMDHTNPVDLTDVFSIHCYWELMWTIQKQPYVPQFVTSRLLKKRY